jgi:orotidine-5'-phosphate decarboxylase
MALAAGLHGVVTGPTEVAALRSAVGPGAWIVVPGIRFKDAPPDDQRRTADARTAAAAGATHLVVGRPITMAGDPERVYHQLCEEAR